MAAFIIWLALCILTGWGASQKGRNPVGWFFLSLIFSPLIGLIALAFARRLEPEAATPTAGAPDPMYPKARPVNQSAGSTTTCRHCGAEIDTDAASCPECGVAQ
ncbi:MAG: zinc-ribbon domain-containing protein [Spirochaetota bacterium]